MTTLQDFGPAEQFHAALRRRAKSVAATIIPDEETALPQVWVRCRDTGPMIADWTGTTYRWQAPDGPWETLPADPEQAADAIALGLGVRAEPEP